MKGIHQWDAPHQVPAMWQPSSHGIIRHTHTHAYIHTYTYTHTYIHTYTCIHTHTHAYIHTYTCIHTHTYIHMHTYTHTHAYIHTYTCTHTPLWCFNVFLKLFGRMKHHVNFTTKYGHNTITRFIFSTHSYKKALARPQKRNEVSFFISIMSPAIRSVLLSIAQVTDQLTGRLLNLLFVNPSICQRGFNLGRL